MIRAGSGIGHTSVVEQRNRTNLIDNPHVLQLIDESRSHEHLIENIPIVGGWNTTRLIIISSRRSVRSFTKESPHRVVQERAMFAIDNSTAPLRDVARHHGMQSFRSDDPWFERVHVEVTDNEHRRACEFLLPLVNGARETRCTLQLIIVAPVSLTL